MRKRLIILLASPPGDLQIGLQALIKTHINADVMAVGDVPSLKHVVERQLPDLVIFDKDLLAKASLKYLQEAIDKWLNTKLIVLVNDNDDRVIFNQSGADLVVTKGFPGTKLLQEVENLLAKER